MDATISCPQCRTSIKLTESLAAPLIAATRAEFEAKLADKDVAMERRLAALNARQADLERAQSTLDATVAAKVSEACAAIAAEEAAKARQTLAGDLAAQQAQIATLQNVLDDRNAKLTAAQEAQQRALRKERELDDQKRELGLELEKRVQAELASVRDKARQEAEASLALKVAEREEVIAGLQRRIEELRKRAEQGSQQLQGEVLELRLEALLSTRFPLDMLEPVAKGEFGGDVLHRVVGPLGKACGALLWETKRTKTWNDAWLAKLRGDQRAARADAALLVSEALPKAVESFDLIDGVWVVHPRFALPVATALRQAILDVAAARIAQDGIRTKTEQVYDYLTGPRFRQRVEAIVEKFTAMQDDLNRERKFMQKQWSKREQQILGVVESTVGLYGDLQGIAGQSMPTIAALDPPQIEDLAD